MPKWQVGTLQDVFRKVILARWNSCWLNKNTKGNVVGADAGEPQGRSNWGDMKSFSDKRCVDIEERRKDAESLKGKGFAR
ncbi:hypothetical protein Plhal304r1_c048g0130581 [Plasmopara halstedii]